MKEINVKNVDILFGSMKIAEGDVGNLIPIPKENVNVRSSRKKKITK